MLQNLPVGPLDASPNATFKWWLWLANLGHETPIVLGDGVVGASLTVSEDDVKEVTCTRVDGSTVIVRLVLRPMRGLEMMVLTSRGWVVLR